VVSQNKPLAFRLAPSGRAWVDGLAEETGTRNSDVVKQALHLVYADPKLHTALRRRLAAVRENRRG
jgi:hypothetical protein